MRLGRGISGLGRSLRNGGGRVGRPKATFCPHHPSPSRVGRARSREWSFPHESQISSPIRAAAPKVSEQYFLWSGESKTESAMGDWQRALKGVFKEAKTPDGHAHRFRDTFAVSLLQAGVPMDRVSVLLGHSSIKVTDRYRSHWPRGRQQQLEAGIRWSWEGSQLESETGSIMWGGPRRVAEPCTMRFRPEPRTVRYVAERVGFDARRRRFPSNYCKISTPLLSTDFFTKSRFFHNDSEFCPRRFR
jgi:hypothetical protein